MGTVYGPVPSRRLGQSLGVDPIPFKTCNYNCVYCQLGRTMPLSHQRSDFFPREDVLAELEVALKQPVKIDYITFVGQGEPTLCASLGWLIRQVRQLSDIPVTVITNGSLFGMPEVREELCAADVVMPTLDAADQETFRRVNRPWPRLHIDDIIQGMASFREQFEGRIWAELMLVQGLNDGDDNLFRVRDALARIQPDQVHINVPTRPPAEGWVQAPGEDGVMRAIAIMEGLGNTRLMTPYDGEFNLARDLPLVQAIQHIIRRHPMRESELILTLADRSPEEVRETLRQMEARGQALGIEYHGHRFWRYAQGGLNSN